MLARTMKWEGQNEGKSVRGLRWICEEVDERLVHGMAQRLDLPEILARILVNRGVTQDDEVRNFLDPKLKNLMPNPFEFKDMDKVVSRIYSALVGRQKIVIFGDYDVDGATSSSVLKRYMLALGADAEIYIPNRIEEGYGPSVEAFEKIIDEGTKLIVTVDCGTLSFDPIDYAASRGVDVIVLDHHLSLPTLPKAHAIINPNRFDETYPFKSLAAVGVVFLTSVAIQSHLKKQSYFESTGVAEPNLMLYLDLVALGTVCDVMNLHGVNRAFVAQGLKLINQRNNKGIAALIDLIQLENAVIQSYHLGYVFGPRINAGGRVGQGILGSRLLSTDDYNEAFNIALQLDALNEERKAIETITLDSAFKQIEERGLDRRPVILVYGQDWHQGILGIIASRIKERYNKLVLVVSVSDSVGKGSARSITGIDIGGLMSQAKQLGHIIEGGGHAMAAGFSLEASKIDEFYNYLCDYCAKKEEEMERAFDLTADAILSIEAINGDLVRLISKASPFGSGNPQPKFILKNVKVINIKVVGDNHIMMIVKDPSSMNPNYTLKCMLFRSVGTELGDVALKMMGKTVSLMGVAQAHFIHESRADFIVEDMMLQSVS